MNYIDFIINNSHFIQRTPNSKIIEYDKYNNIRNKYDNFEDMPNYYDIFFCVKDMEENPDKYFIYHLSEDGTEIIIEDFKNSNIPSHIKIPDFIEDKPVVEFDENIICEHDILSEKLKQIQLPSYLKYLPILQGTALETMIIPENIEIIPVYCFDSCEKLKKVTLPAGIERISYGAFAECESLVEINIPEYLRRIDDFAFFNTGIKNISFNKRLEYIENSAFKHCNLKNITMYEKTKYHPWAFEYNDKLKIKTISEKIIINEKER